MSDTRPGVLITRPEPAAQETAAIVAGLGFTPVLAPMLVITAHVWTGTMAPAQAVLVTSANALSALARLQRTIPVFAVGDATAARAGTEGFVNVASAGRDAAALVELVVLSCDPKAGALLLATGAGLGLDLAADLRRRGYVVQRRVAYRARPAICLPPDAVAALGTGCVRSALFFSAASARAFVACVAGATNQLDGIEALAISEPTAAALSLLPWRRIRVASHPNHDELVGLLS